jgi:geranylgeranyl diphosphate synthase type I
MTRPLDITALSGRVDAELQAVFGSRDMPLYKMMTYHLGWADRHGGPEPGGPSPRLHGVACLAACLPLGGDIEKALPAAAAVEMVNCFVEIHDDVQSGRPYRGTREAVWSVWGPAQAINAGDGMHALARLALLRLMERGVSPEATFHATKLLDHAALALCEGRFQDLEAQERLDMPVAAYLKMASAKSGALLACAMQLGALAAGGGDAVLSAMGACGTKTGVALQVQGDIRELWGSGGGASVAVEVLNKKKLLPVAYALEKAALREKRRLGDIYFKRVLQPDDVATVRQIVEGLGARDFCEGLVKQYHADAIAALSTAGMPAAGVRTMREFTTSLLA